MICLYDHIAVFILDGFTGETSRNTLLEAFDLFLSLHESLHCHARNLVFPFAAVYFPDNQLLGHIHQTSGEISRVCSTQGRIGQTLAGAVGRHEILQYVQTLTEIGLDGKLNGVSGGICHQSPHTGKLLDLLIGTTGAGIRHHKDVVVLIQSVQQGRGQDCIRLLPGLHYLFVALLLGNQAALVVSRNLIHRILGFLNQLRLLGRHGHIGNRYGHGRLGGIFVAHGLDIIQHLCGPGGTVGIDYFLQNLFQAFLAYMEIHFQLQLIARNTPVHKAQILGQDLVENKTPHGGLNDIRDFLSIRCLFAYADLDLGLEADHAVLIGENSFVDTLKAFALALDSRTLLGQIVNTQHHILGRHRHRAAVRGLQKVVGREQKESALRLGLHGQGKVHSHLVSVEVGVKSRTNQRMKLDSFTLYQYRLKGLDAKSVQGRSTVQHNRMLFDHIFQHIPYFRLHLALYHLLGALNVVSRTVLHQFLHHEGFKELNSHLFGKAALVNLQLRSHHDNGTAGIVYTFSQKVLAETAGLSFQHIGQGL